MNGMLKSSLIVWGILATVSTISYLGLCFHRVGFEIKKLAWWEIPGVLLLRIVALGLVGSFLYLLIYPINEGD